LFITILMGLVKLVLGVALLLRMHQVWPERPVLLFMRQTSGILELECTYPPEV
jgi:hypothetical protein